MLHKDQNKEALDIFVQNIEYFDSKSFDFDIESKINLRENLLSQLKDYCGGEREINVSRELTKKFEEHIGKNINAVSYTHLTLPTSDLV